jgi:hypothetical protein
MECPAATISRSVPTNDVMFHVDGRTHVGPYWVYLLQVQDHRIPGNPQKLGQSKIFSRLVPSATPATWTCVLKAHAAAKRNLEEPAQYVLT